MNTTRSDSLLGKSCAHPIHGERANGGCEQASENCTMTWDGWARLTALQPVVERVLRENVVGDFAEVRQDHAVPGIHRP